MKNMFTSVKNAHSALLNIIYPKKCQGCCTPLHYKSTLYLCKGCLKKIKINNPPFCIKCGRPIYGPPDLSAVCGQCINAKYSFDRAFSCCNYDGLVKELIHKFKYEQKKYLLCLFNKLMSAFVKNNIDIKAIDYLVPVPLHRGKLQQRGFDQSLLLSKTLSKEFNLPLSYNILKRKKDTRQQTALDRKARLANVKNAFFVKNNGIFNKKRILLIDDVFTTAATANECACALKKAGAESVYLLTLARGAG